MKRKIATSIEDLSLAPDKTASRKVDEYLSTSSHGWFIEGFSLGQYEDYRASFLDLNNGTVYVIFDKNDSFYNSALTIDVDGKLYKSLKKIGHYEIIKKDIIDLNNILDEIFANRLIDIDELENLSEQYYDIIEYESMLVQTGGNGYESVFINEAEELLVKANELVSNGLIDELSEAATLAFFSYEKSLIKDLSIKNDRRNYYWNKADFCKFFFEVNLNMFDQWIYGKSDDRRKMNKLRMFINEIKKLKEKHELF